MNIAMWSGPRNLSTAMMYAFGARADCAVWDEPYYAAYLAATGIDHPMGEAIVARYETDPDALDELFAPTLAGDRRGVGVVTFSMEGCDVRVSDDGTV